MVLLPVRKCYHVAKICSVVVLVVFILGLFEHWRGGKRAARAQYLDPVEEEYERQILEDEARIIPGLGDEGAAAQLLGEDKRLGEESEKKLAMNVYLSDRIAYNRTLRDPRNPACGRVTYDAELPSASVVIIFHNEPYSVLLRTVWSVINSARRDRPEYRRANRVESGTGRAMTLGYPGQDPASPYVYLKEIILVDDNSTLPELRGKLSHYARSRLPPGLVRLLRLPDRVGLTRARLAGARYARGDALVFLDAHCEAATDWLRPLLQRVKEDPSHVVVPIIDVVESNDFYYSVGDPAYFQGLMRARTAGARAARGDALVFLDAHCEPAADWLRPLLQRVRHKRDAVCAPVIDVLDQSTLRLDAADKFQVGGFTFQGHFTWIDVPERESRRRGSDIAPTWSPTMAGGLFAIDRKYYWELGAYDEQMAGWGGENLEMSFRIWQCGGSLETVPCSRVGHVFRAFHPYGMPAHSDTHGINTARMADVWMDEYAELFYLHRPDLRKSPLVGDVTHRKVLREKLRCKSFQWYLDHVYPEKYVPVRDSVAYGRFRNAASGLCLDTLQREGEAAALGLYPCHPTLQGTQYLSLSRAGQLRDEERCAELQRAGRAEEQPAGGEPRKLLLRSCRAPRPGQTWSYLPTKQLQHAGSGLCLDAAAGPGGDAAARPCRSPAAPTQQWAADHSELHAQPAAEDSASAERDARLEQLRQRGNHSRSRVSRSLLSHAAHAAHAPHAPDSTHATHAPQSRRRRRHRKKKQRHRKNKRRKSPRRRPRRKNKFVLTLVRSRNGTEEHLEADVYCRHRRLRPNDTFVRDLVSVLNGGGVKVINNGRVFERNRVTELARPAPGMLDKLESPALDTAGAAPREPAEARTRRWRSREKTTAPPPPAPLRGPPADEPRTPPAADKRIIIEDFVEVTPAQPPQRSSKRRRKRKRGGSAAPATQAPADAEAGGDELLPPSARAPDSVEEPTLLARPAAAAAGGEPSSVEDSPLASSSEVRKRAGYSSDTELEAPYEERAPGPLELVLRSNLTFQLDDEFFNWRSADRSAPDAAPDTAPDGGDEHYSTGRGTLRLAPAGGSASDSESGSASSAEA